MKEVLLELLRVQYAPNAPKGHRSILYMIIDKGHTDKGHKALCPLSIGTMDDKSGRCSNVRDLYEQMYPVAADHHRFLVYPPAYGSKTFGLRDDGEALQLENLTWYVNWAREDTRIVGFSPYQYGDDVVPYDLGASSLPTVWNALVALGRQIVASNRHRHELIL